MKIFLRHRFEWPFYRSSLWMGLRNFNIFSRTKFSHTIAIDCSIKTAGYEKDLELESYSMINYNLLSFGFEVFNFIEMCSWVLSHRVKENELNTNFYNLSFICWYFFDCIYICNSNQGVGAFVKDWNGYVLFTFYVCKLFLESNFS